MPAVLSKIDLHSHSKASDGALSPSELVQRACDRGLTHLALTDHDTVLGITEAQDAARGRLELIPGAELSTMWNNYQIHIVGLFIDIKSQSLLKYLEGQKVFREERAREIGAKLERQGFANAYEECRKRAAEGASITRGNYARYIVEMGKAQDTNEAFNYYLKKGKSCYVKTQWPDISVACDAIKASGGVAVLAHPRRYEMTNTKLRELMEYFKSCGGEAMEVGCSQMSPNDLNYMTSLCKKYDFLASLGSDFHHEGPFRELGLGLVIPEELKKVWECPQAEKFNFPSEA